MPDVDALLAAYDTQMRSAETTRLPPGVRAEPDGPIVRIVGQHRGFVSSPPDLGVEGDELDALIARQRDFFAARGEAVEWKTRASDRPTDIVARLRAQGFVAEDQETVLVDLAAEMASYRAPLPEGVIIRRATARTDMDRIAAMESTVRGHDMGWLAEDLTGRIEADAGGFTVFVAEAAGVIVAAAWLVERSGTEFAGLWGGSTLAPWRGQGIYRALVARRARLGVDHGVRYLQVDASDASRPILERLGFVAITTTTPYVWTPS
jgi:GNAT superfamily N-acetyltransferase